MERRPVLLAWPDDRAGRNIFYQWTVSPDIAPLMSTPIRDLQRTDEDPARLRQIFSAILNSNAFAGQIAAAPRGPIDVPMSVVHRLGDRFEGAGPINGVRNIGRLVFEDTDIAEALPRLKRYDAIVCASDWNARILRAHGVAHVSVIPEAIDQMMFFPAPKAGLFSRDRFHIFTGGAIDFRKAQDLTLLAFREFARRRDDVALVTAWHGASPQAAEGFAGRLDAPPKFAPDGRIDARDWAAANGIDSERIIDLGRLSDAMTPTVLREMDCALLPSRAEGGGDFTAMAAMACGLPVILSRSTAMADLIGDDTCYPLEDQSPVKSPDGRGTSGWGDSDVGEILEALEALYTSRELRARIGAKAARFMQAFTWADHAKALGDVALGAAPAQPQRPLPGPAPPDLTAQALAHHKAGRLKEAEALYRQIARSGPAASQGPANYNLGVMLRERDELEEAAAVFRKAAALRPDHARTFNNLGGALEALGRLDEAETSLRRALALQADYPNALYNLGNVLKATDRAAEAVEAYGRALALQPQDADAWGNAALALQALGRLEEAERHLRRALALRPGDARLHDNLGLLLTARGQLDEALAAHQHALRLDPMFAAAQANLAMVLADLGREAEAQASLKRAIAVDPRYAPGHNNLGSIEMERGALEAAGALFEEAIRLKPDYADARWNLGLVRLLQGRFDEGWAGYEWRLKLKGAARPPFAQPAWSGEDLSGQTILLLAEQGAGDAIQFIRYAPLLRARGASVSVLAQPTLARLFAGADGVDRVIVLGEPLPRFDCYAPLPSLPGLFKTRLDTIPGAVPYLQADAVAAEAWRARLDARPGLKVGLVWRGNPEHSRDRIRSMPPEALAGLAATPGVQVFSLQLNASAEELAALGGVEDITGGLRDWADTAALLAALDMVVSVDTAVAHLAGALGRPVFLMLPHAPDWRWLLERDDSPWYPSMRLFRQSRRGDWASVADQVRQAICAFPR